MMNEPKIPRCCHCRSAERDEDAYALYTGSTDYDRPFRGYLCADHADALVSNGWVLRECEIVDPDALTCYYTGYDSLEHLSHSYPTLQTGRGSGKKRVREFARLRAYYRHVTGRDAAR